MLNDTGGDGDWRSLTKETFRVTDEKFQNFPKIRSHKVLYSILQEFVAKEGFYVFAETLPWGVLSQHFFKGKFVGELMIPTNVLGVKLNGKVKNTF